jgi:hypothetical protein
VREALARAVPNPRCAASGQCVALASARRTSLLELEFEALIP